MWGCLRLFLVIFAGVHGSSDNATVTFYEHAPPGGASHTVTLFRNVCYNIPCHYNERFSFAETNGYCLVIYEHADCGGLSDVINPTGKLGMDAARFGPLNDKVSSCKLCDNKYEPEPTTTTPPPPPEECTGSPSNDTWLDKVRPETREFWRVGTEEMNWYRRRHNIQDLRSDDPKIHTAAQNFAEVLADSEELQYSKNPCYDETLAFVGARSAEEAVRNAVRQWYEQEGRTYYGFDRPEKTMKPKRHFKLNFSRVVSKSAEYVGLGTAWNPKIKKYAVVAFYSPTTVDTSR